MIAEMSKLRVDGVAQECWVFALGACGSDMSAETSVGVARR